MRIIIGHGYESYSDTLKFLKIDTLFERREKLCLRFAMKSLKVEHFKHLFPLHKKQHDMTTKASMKYEVCKTNSKRLNVSTIPHLQRLLNKQAELKKIEFRKLKLSKMFVTSYPCLI